MRIFYTNVQKCFAKTRVHKNVRKKINPLYSYSLADELNSATMHYLATNFITFFFILLRIIRNYLIVTSSVFEKC